MQKHTFGNDGFLYQRGGRRRGLAIVTDSRTAEEVLRNLLPPPSHDSPPAQPGPARPLDTSPVFARVLPQLESMDYVDDHGMFEFSTDQNRRNRRQWEKFRN